MDEFGLGQADVAQRVSKSRPAVANSLRLLKLEENVQKMLIDGQISMGHARALLPLEIPEEQLAVAQKIAEKELSVRETEKLVKELLKTGTGKKEIKPVEQKEDPSIEKRIPASRSSTGRLKRGCSRLCIQKSPFRGRETGTASF